MLRLTHPPARLSLEQRRAWRLIAIGDVVVVVSALAWGLVLYAAGTAIGAMAYLAVALACAGSLLLLHRGRLIAAGRIAVSVLLAFLIYNALWLSTPTPDVPRSTHQYLLALGLASLLITRGDRAWFRHGVPLVSLVAYALLSGSHFSMTDHSPLSPGAHQVAAWFDHFVSVAVLLTVMHVMHSDVVRREAAEIELRDAILRDELELHYQPQVDEGGQVLGIEALVRWNHPQRGQLAPGTFIPMAEECGLIGPLGEWVLRRACRQLAAWSSKREMRGLVLSVNVSAQQFEHPQFVPQLLGLLVQHRVAPSRLKLELTEGALARDLRAVATKMATLRREGVRISLDDFGTGFSSLSLLKNLPLDQLKIDRAFVRHLGRAAHDEAIARTIIGLGETLGLEVIAEGVETPLQYQTLQRLGCRHFQGFLFARPMALADLESALQPRPTERTAVLPQQRVEPTQDTLPMPLG